MRVKQAWGKPEIHGAWHRLSESEDGEEEQKRGATMMMTCEVDLAFIRLSPVLTDTYDQSLKGIITLYTLWSKSLASCDSRLHTNTDLLASWKFFWCVHVSVHTHSWVKKCGCVCMHPFSVKSWTNPGTWFSHSMKPKQSSLWQSAAVKIQLLKETREQADGAKKISPPTSGSNGHLFNLWTITPLPSFPKRRLKHDPKQIQLFCVVLIECTHTHLSSRASLASSILST